MTDKKRVALIYGGRGLEHSVSVAGAKNLMSLIDGERYDTLTVRISKNGEFSLCSPFCAENDGISVHPICKDGIGGLTTDGGEFFPIDCAFPLLHGDFGEDGTVQGLLSSLGIAFVGCDTRASAVCLDKAVTKAVAERLGIPTVSWSLITESSLPREQKFPLFVKPDCLGSSYGAGKAENEEQFDSLLRSASALGGGRVLVEEFKSPLRELECAFFEAQGERVFTAAGEILCDGFYSYERKYSQGGAKTSARADISKADALKIREYSEALCSFIGIRHLARIDFFLSDGIIYLNEVNTMPGMTDKSLYLRLLSESGISPKKAVNRLLADAVAEGAT